MSPSPMVLVVANRRNAGMRPDHLGLVEQREPARHLEHALDHEHHVGPAGVVFVEAQRGVGLQRIGQDALAELGDLLAVLQDDGVLADQIDAADVAVEVDADARPVEPGRHLLDVGRLAGAVVALDHHPAVVLEAGQDGERHVLGEHVVVVRDRGRGRRAWSRRAPRGRCRCRTAGAPTPSCPACREPRLGLGRA